MKNFSIYIIISIILIILLPFSIINIGGGIKQLVVDDFKKNFGAGQTTIKVYISKENKTVEMNLEEYVKGVISAELPKDFELEAMKAQAVAARTYALARKNGLYKAQDHVHDEADICTDVHCQVWVSKEKAFENWGSDADKIWDKIEKAVTQTAGQVITYEGTMINPLYHSNSGGVTESVAAVWKTEDVPYLTSVASPGEDKYEKEFNGTVNISYSDFVNKIKKYNKSTVISEKDPIKDIKIGMRTASDRVLDIKVGNITMKGTDFRTLFNLKSTNFIIEKTKDNNILITTYGNGHGVGMSQCGANVMASEGKNYIDILTNYYLGVEIVDYKSING